MADIYWVAVGAATAASTTANWNTNPDGSGVATAPTTNDTIHFGDEVSVQTGVGFAKCNYDITTTLTHLKTSSGYNGATVTSTDISFTAPDTITHSHSNWEDLGFGAGMYITVSGAADAANNQPRTILTISSNTMTVSASPSLATAAAGPSITITSDISLDISASFTTNQLTLNTKIINSSGSNATIKFVGSPPDASNRYVFNGENAVLENVDDLTYEYDTGVSDRVLFDDGPYPIVVGISTNFSPEYYAPTTDQHGSVEMRTLRLDGACTFAPNTSPAASPTLNASKVFDITKTSNFQLNLNTFDTGFSTFSFAPDNNNWPVPISGDTSYGSGAFVSKFYNLIIRTPSTAGHVTVIPNDRTLSVNSLTVESGAVLRGQTTVNTGTTSTICSVRRPLIKGAWNFSQLSDGVYVSVLSDSFPITPSSGAKGLLQISNGSGTFSSDSKLTWASGTSTLLVDGKLTVTGLIDPTGMEFTPVATNPGGVAANTIWVNSGDNNRLYYGSSHISGGGGGGGGGGGSGVTSIATTAPITGGTITSTGTIGISAATTSAAGSMSSADKTKLDGIEASADVTDATNVAAAGAVMSVAPITLDTSNNRVGINEASPDYDLHVHSSHNYYSVKFEHREGQTLFNRFGHIQTQNDNSSPTDGSVLDNPVWQIGQRDGGQFDIAFGNISNQIVAASDALISFKRASNSNTGAKQIGFFGATAASQPSAQDPMAFGFNPGTATPNEQALQQSIDSIIAALQSIGLLT